MTAFWSAIISGAILSVPLSLAVWLALRVVPRRALNAATRYAIWWVVLAVTLALPLSYSKWRTAPPAPHASSVSRQSLATEPQREPLTALAPAPVSRRISMPIAIPANRWLQPILDIWIAASLFLLVRVFVGYAVLYRRSSRATAAPPELDSRIAITTRVIRLAVSSEIAIPLATGPLRPTVLIPASLLTRMSADDLEQIARHEAAHLERYDDCALFPQRVIEALFALHPVVRWLTRQIDLEREIACDDIAVGQTGHARFYADCLTRAVVLCGGVRTPLAAANVADGRSHLSRRIELLVDKSRSRCTDLLKRRFAAAAVALVCAAGFLAKTPLLVAFAVPRVVVSVPAPAQSVATIPPGVPPGASAVGPPAPRRPLLVAQTAPQSPRSAEQFPSTEPEVREYVLGANDILAVAVFDEPQPPGTYVIGAEGKMAMPLIGTIGAAGLTVHQLRDLIAEKLGAYIRDPVVNVQLLRNNTKRYTLLGLALRTGPYPLRPGTTILDALAAAGGFTEFANAKKVYLLRGTAKYFFNYKEVIQGQHMEQNIMLEDGDLIVVPE